MYLSLSASPPPSARNDVSLLDAISFPIAICWQQHFVAMAINSGCTTTFCCSRRKIYANIHYVQHVILSIPCRQARKGIYVAGIDNI